MNRQIKTNKSLRRISLRQNLCLCSGFPLVLRGFRLRQPPVTQELIDSAIRIVIAKPFYSVITNSGSINNVKRTGDQLFNLIISPVANQLAGKRLLVVADGILQYIVLNGSSRLYGMWMMPKLLN